MEAALQACAYAEWLQSRPGVKISPKVTFVQSDGAPRGVTAVTSAALAEEEDVFVIPEPVALAFRASDLSRADAGLAARAEQLGPWLCLMLTMVYEALRPATSSPPSPSPSPSPWAPYLASLPDTGAFESLMFWSEAELAQLQGSAVVGRVGRADADAAILQQLLPLVREYPRVFCVPATVDLDGPEGRDWFLRLAHRMGSLIMAYAFDVEGGEAGSE
ncbi:hypothetical protein KEM52_004491, partial [Ascosphaera acerosa]